MSSRHKNPLLPQHRTFLLSGKADATQLQTEHFELDVRISKAIERRECATLVAAAKLFKLRLKQQMARRGIDTITQPKVGFRRVA